MSTISLTQYLQHNSKPLRQTSLAFLIKNDSILLAMKKRGFGRGKWNGVGGKPNRGESIEKTAVREMQEEINVTASLLEKVAILSFYFPNKPEDNQEVHTFFVTKWKGEPRETEEMRPQWYKTNNLPFTSMWADDNFWLPKVLEGNLIKGSFLFNPDNEIIDYSLQSVRDL